MRPRPRAIGAPALVLCGVSAALVAGCSTGPSYTTGSLRPPEGMVRDRPRTYPDGSYRSEPYVTQDPGSSYGSGYPQRQYTDPGTPTPPSYRNGANGYGASGMETGSIGPRRQPGASPYASDARWRQTPPERWPQTSAARSAPMATGSVRATPHVVSVREGDTLYSLSRQYNVPVADLMAANRLESERIAVGQQLTIPIRYR